MTDNAPEFTPQLLGQTEKALNALLIRELAAPGLTEHQWIALTLTARNERGIGLDQLVGQLVGALKGSDTEATQTVDSLVTAGYLEVADRDGDPTATVTDAGRHVHAGIRATVAELTGRFWGDLPSGDLAATGRVLSIVLQRANAELGRAGLSPEPGRPR